MEMGWFEFDFFLLIEQNEGAETSANGQSCVHVPFVFLN